MIQLSAGGVGDPKFYLKTNYNRILVSGGNTFTNEGRLIYQTTFVDHPINLLKGEFVTSMATSSHSLFLTNKNRLLVEGDNYEGQLGLGDIKYTKTITECPLDLLPGELITDISAGCSHSLVKTSKNRLLVCGANEFGELGLGHKNKQNKFVECPLDLLPGEYLTDIAAGYHHSLIKINQNKLMACGGNKFGQLGLGDKKDRMKFVKCTITLQPDEIIKAIKTGFQTNGSYLVTNQDRFLVCGFNGGSNNSLGFKDKDCIVQKTFIESNLSLQPDEHIVETVASNGACVITDQKRLYACGKNHGEQLDLKVKSSFTSFIFSKKENKLIKQNELHNQEEFAITNNELINQEIEPNNIDNNPACTIS